MNRRPAIVLSGSLAAAFCAAGALAAAGGQSVGWAAAKVPPTRVAAHVAAPAVHRARPASVDPSVGNGDPGTGGPVTGSVPQQPGPRSGEDPHPVVTPATQGPTTTEPGEDHHGTTTTTEMATTTTQPASTTTEPGDDHHGPTTTEP
ncbi:MAG TPA: hypothetical protein VMT43_14425, partial [Acidimicrobiales bacterium]|nr:hypothetical protein [Acidimicrobiales bacterium]